MHSTNLSATTALGSWTECKQHFQFDTAEWTNTLINMYKYTPAGMQMTEITDYRQWQCPVLLHWTEYNGWSVGRAQL